MALESDTNVEEIRQVQDGNGNNVPPANETEQQALKSEQQATNAALGNHPGLTAFEHATGGTVAEALPANAVPEGVSVVVAYKDGNAGSVYVGNNSAQPIGLKAHGQSVTVDVEDTSAIYVQTPTSGDSVGVLFES